MFGWSIELYGLAKFRERYVLCRTNRLSWARRNAPRRNLNHGIYNDSCTRRSQLIKVGG